MASGRREWGVDGVDARDLRVMWWRRPQPYMPSDDVTDAPGPDVRRRRVCGRGRRAVVCLDAVWVNDPDRDEAASRKMWQLKVASEIGLRVPRTCMTNSPERARQFIAGEPGDVIYKAFSATPETWRETRVVTETQIGQLDQVRLAPVIFQEAIPGGCDIRVTMVGDRRLPGRDRRPGGRIRVRLPAPHRAVGDHCRSRCPMA